MFKGEKGEDFIKLAKDLLKFHKENSDFFCEIIRNEQHQRRERVKAFNQQEDCLDWGSCDNYSPTDTNNSMILSLCYYKSSPNTPHMPHIPLEMAIFSL